VEKVRSKAFLIKIKQPYLLVFSSCPLCSAALRGVYAFKNQKQLTTKVRRVKKDRSKKFLINIIQPYLLSVSFVSLV